jgi:hypothetical protein
MHTHVVQLVPAKNWQDSLAHQDFRFMCDVATTKARVMLQQLRRV